jgi:hypothetical protein
MTWIVIVSLGLLTSLRFCRAKWTRLAFHRLNGYDFAVLVRPMMASFRKNLCKFCPNLARYKPSKSLFCQTRNASDYIYITQ